ncbi:hypothetical protein HLH35_05475 [Gluconacetobacter asukensis]|uniref:POTRA domain-containing protein n=1 Tax=Gluconacetobacter asukensis TaxID=1017181 RepID=A0A7W4IYT1_9PROT|nr:hypothetical protein [Gluconacetobacter asukensis]
MDGWSRRRPGRRIRAGWRSLLPCWGWASRSDRLRAVHVGWRHWHGRIAVHHGQARAAFRPPDHVWENSVLRTRHLLARSALAVAIATGFASASFSGPQAFAASPPSATTPLKLKSLVITGNKQVSTDEILAALPFHQGDTVTRDQIAAGAQDVMGVYQKKNVGLKFGQKMKFAGAAVYVEWAIEEQAPEVVQTALVVDKIVFEGNKKLSAADLTAATKLRPGSTIDQAAMAADQQAVQKAYQDHGVGAAIQVVPSQPAGDNHVVLTYQITEK